MRNPFSTSEMAAGYATARPPVHERILQRITPHLQGPIRRALDMGCGAGVSTRALQQIAAQRIGLEPAEAMVRWAGSTDPKAWFLVGAAEAVPFAANSMDLITAAGSLNYVHLDRALGEAARVLAPNGLLVVYDFSQGRSVLQGDPLESWFGEFRERYPSPPAEARFLDPAILADLASGFTVLAAESFSVNVPLSRRAYVDYILTESNVAAAIRSGVAAKAVRSWCETTLPSVWPGSDGAQRDVVFPCYFVCLTPTLPS